MVDEGTWVDDDDAAGCMKDKIEQIETRMVKSTGISIAANTKLEKGEARSLGLRRAGKRLELRRLY